MTFSTGDTVMLNPAYTTSDYRSERVGGNGYNMRYITLRQGQTGVVTRPNTSSSMVRVNDEGTIWVPNVYLQLAGLSATGRRRGTPPEGGIAADDPRIEWLWDDISEYAERSQYCGTFDTILRDLHLPPRKRKFAAIGEIGGLQVTAQVMAKSQREANEELARRIAATVAAEVTA